MTTVADIAESIRTVGVRLQSQMKSFGWSTSKPFSQFVGGAAAIPISSDALAGYCEIVAARVERLNKAQLDVDGFGEWLGELAPQLDQIQFNTMNQGHYSQFTNALSILQMIDAAIPAPPQRDPKVNWEDIKDQKSLIPKDLAARLRSIDARLAELEPRSKEISKKIIDIENAHAAADQLPTDLAELAERREELAGLIERAQELARQIESDSESASSARTQLEEDTKVTQKGLAEITENARGVLAQSEHALRGATAVGLAKAFEARKTVLSKAGFWWTIGLAVALLIALLIGWERVTTLKEVLTGQASSTVVVVNAILAILGIGAPVWFAWLATKQIGTTFRLAEDYAFKASVAQAYEGYRTEAVSIDADMSTRLFSAALDRLEEAPIRLVDHNYHSSPLQEILSNPSIRNSLEKVPNLAEKIMALIPARTGVAQVATGALAGAAAAVPASILASDTDVEADPDDDE